MDTEFEPLSNEAQRIAVQAVTTLLNALGQDLSRPGLQKTPERYIKFLAEVMTPPPLDFTVFEEPGADEMVVQGPIPFTSVCEHHIVPFFGHAWVGYLPKDHKVVGLSKLSRCVLHYAAGLNNQERITARVALRLAAELGSPGVGVVLRAEHLCMKCRGVRVNGVQTITSKLLGEFKSNSATRSEFLKAVEMLPVK